MKANTSKNPFLLKVMYIQGFTQQNSTLLHVTRLSLTMLLDEACRILNSQPSICVEVSVPPTRFTGYGNGVLFLHSRSRFPRSSQIPNPVNIFCFSPYLASQFTQIPDRNPVSTDTYSLSQTNLHQFSCITTLLKIILIQLFQRNDQIIFYEKKKDVLISKLGLR